MRWKTARACKSYTFSASHRLTCVPKGHQCARLHGHNYKVEVVIAGEMNPEKMWVQDFADIDKQMKPILDLLDHYHLNDIPGLENPTAECLAGWILSRYSCKNVYKIRVYETDKCYAEVFNSEGRWPAELRM